VLVERQVAALYAVNSTKKVPVPTFDSERAKVDRLLEQTKRREYEPEQAALIAALGLGG
jgi:hypothetical protein